MDGQNAVMEGTNPGRGPTTGGIEIWIYDTNLPNGSMPLYARFGENVTRVVSTSEPLRVPGFNLVPSRTPSNLAYYPVNCRLETARAGFWSPFCENPPPTLLLLEKVSANLSITSTSTKRKPAVFLLFVYLPPTQSRNSRPHPQKLQSKASSCLGTSCQTSAEPHSGTGRGRPRQPGRWGWRSRYRKGDHDIERAMIQALEPLQNMANFDALVSIANDYNQTLAHFAVSIRDCSGD